jgi:cytochrome c peroxidase
VQATQGRQGRQKKRWVRLALIAGAFAVPVSVRAAMALQATHAVTSPGPHDFAGVSAAKTRDVMSGASAVTAASPQADLIAAGQALFESTTLARHGESCATCHSNGTANASAGTIVHPLVPGDFFGPRDPISLIGVGQTAPYRWAGDVPTLEEMVTKTVVGFFKDGATQPKSETAKQVAALVAYLNSIKAPQTAFDLGTLSPAALRGQEVFEGKGQCMSCHGGPLLTDNKPHNTGVPQTPGGTDPGALTLPGAFNTPALRDLRNSAPYMHNGVIADLRQVVEFYNSRSTIAPLQLTPQEINDLVAYLEAL